jgi:ribosomal subunit interface protein
MKTEVAILHHGYPSDVRELVEDRLQGLVRYFDRTVSVRALLERVRDEHRVELIANVRRGVVLKVDARGETFGSTVDEAVHRMARVLARHKERLVESGRSRLRA